MRRWLRPGGASGLPPAPPSEPDPFSTSFCVGALGGHRAHSLAAGGAPGPSEELWDIGWPGTGGRGEKSREYGRPLSLRGHCVSDGPRVNDDRGTPGRAPGLADRRSGGPQGRRLTRTVAPESLRSRRLRWTVPEVLPWGRRRPGDGRGGPSRRRCGSWNVLGGGRVLQARRRRRGVSEGSVPSPVAATHLLSRQTEARTAGRAAGPAAPRARLRFAGEPRMCAPCGRA